MNSSDCYITGSCRADYQESKQLPETSYCAQPMSGDRSKGRVVWKHQQQTEKASVNPNHVRDWDSGPRQFHSEAYTWCCPTDQESGAYRGATQSVQHKVRAALLFAELENILL